MKNTCRWCGVLLNGNAVEVAGELMHHSCAAEFKEEYDRYLEEVECLGPKWCDCGFCTPPRD